MAQQKKKLSISMWIFIAMAAGIIVGLVGLLFPGFAEFSTGYIRPIGTIFINLLKFVVVPIVVLSIVDGIISLKDIRKVGSIGWKIVAYYLITTALAIVIGLVVANLFKGGFPLLDTSGLEYEAPSANFMDTVVNIFPSSFFGPLVSATMLQVIVIALFLGFGIILAGEKGKIMGDWITSCNAVFMEIMMMVIKIAPIGVFCLMTWVVANQGPAILGSLALVLAVAYIGYILQAGIVYSAAVKGLAGISPIEFFKGIAPAMVFAFSSTSSIATLPITKECTDKMGADSVVSSFTLPLGATINMDGTAIYMGVCSIFIASCYGISLTFGQMLTIILTATLASIGTAGTAGAGMIMLTMVLSSVGIPVEGIAIIAGVDRLFDMGRTTINIVGDAAGALVVSNSQKKLSSKN